MHMYEHIKKYIRKHASLFTRYVSSFVTILILTSLSVNVLFVALLL